MKTQVPQADLEATRALEAAKQSIKNIEATQDRMKTILDSTPSVSSYLHRPNINHYYESDKVMGVAAIIIAILLIAAVYLGEATVEYVRSSEATITRLSNRLADVEHSDAIPQPGQPVNPQPLHNSTSIR